MKVIKPSFEIINPPDPNFILHHLETAARVCYKSEDKMTSDSAKNLLNGLIKSGHHSVLEHVSVSVRIICDRGISHEIVRHRLCSFSQESTRYVNYSKGKFGNEITVIAPSFWHESSREYQFWYGSMLASESDYLALLSSGAKPQEARSVLPNSLKTEIIVTANLREWHHIFNLRCSKAAHPQIREIMIPLLGEFAAFFPLYYGKLHQKYVEQEA